MDVVGLATIPGSPDGGFWGTLVVPGYTEGTSLLDTDHRLCLYSGALVFHRWSLIRLYDP